MMKKKTSTRRRLRAALGSDAVISLNEAALRLPIRDAAARQWLEDEDLVRLMGGRPVVVWGRVLERLERLKPA